jgi:hypothetical protein
MLYLRVLHCAPVQPELQLQTGLPFKITQFPFTQLLQEGEHISQL